MRRRKFITLLGGATAAWPLAARAQQPGGLRRIGVLMNGAATKTVPHLYVAAFAQGLRQLGCIEGQGLLKSRMRVANGFFVYRQRTTVHARACLGIISTDQGSADRIEK